MTQHIVVWRAEPWAGDKSRIDTIVADERFIGGICHEMHRNGVSPIFSGTVKEFRRRLTAKEVKDGK